MADVLIQIRRLNCLGSLSIAEPFAGGAGAALSLLYLEETHSVHINDADVAIRDFWWAALRRPAAFMRLLDETPVNIIEWQRQRDAYRARATSRLRRGFAAFYLNRSNRSGIIMNGGPVGGVKQTGAWKLDARFNRSTLRARLEKLADYRDRITESGVDGIELIESLQQKDVFFFIDPPYFHKGDLLYLNSLDSDYHVALASRLRHLSNAAWVLTYDDCREVRSLYEGWASLHPFSLRYAASERRRGRELLITPGWMRLPSTQASEAIEWRPERARRANPT